MTTLNSLIADITSYVTKNCLSQRLWLSFTDNLQSKFVNALFALLLNPTSVNLLDGGAK